MSRLDVAEAAPIKHEHHMEGAASQPPLSTPPDFVPIKQEQATGNGEAQLMADTREVRMTEPGAETDPLQNGHPAELPTPFEPQAESASEPLANDTHAAGVVSSAPLSHSSSLAEQQSAGVLMGNGAAAAQAAQQQHWHGSYGHTQPQSSSAAGMHNGSEGQVQEGGVASAAQALSGPLQTVKAEPSHHTSSNGMHAVEPMDVDIAGDPARLHPHKTAAIDAGAPRNCILPCVFHTYFMLLSKQSHWRLLTSG